MKKRLTWAQLRKRIMAVDSTTKCKEVETLQLMINGRTLNCGKGILKDSPPIELGEGGWGYASVWVTRRSFGSTV